MALSTAEKNDMLALDEYDIDPVRGFLPARDPLTHLPPAFAAWEELIKDLPVLLTAGRVRQAIEQAPLLDSKQLIGREQYRRALLLLSYFGHAYIFGEATPSARIPATIAVPWYAVAKKLKRHPVLDYASHILYNWRRFDPTGAIDLDNLARLEHLLGGMDEDWFGMIHIAIEAQAGPGLYALVVAQDGVRAGNVELVTEQLAIVERALYAILEVLMRMGEKCDPYIYYNRVRPFLSGWKDNPALPDGVLYEGVTAYHGQPQFFRGGSGAQSAIIPAMDNALGIAFNDNPFGHYMRSLQEYMPGGHRAFIGLMVTRPAIRQFVLDHASTEPALVAAYDRCIEASIQFRHDHLHFAGAYIHAQSQHSSANSNEVGTGGTPFMPYLKQHTSELRSCLIAPQRTV